MNQNVPLDRKNIFWRGDKAYAYCPRCGKLVRVNKPMFGSVHLCLDEEREG